MIILGLITGCAITSNTDEPVEKEDEKSAWPVMYRGFEMDHVLKGETGEIHYHLYVPQGYGGGREYSLLISLPGYEGLYFQGVGSNLEKEEFVFEAMKYDQDMIIVAPQLDDWGMTSARQTIELTEYLLAEYDIDADRVFIEGYSGGGETMSLVLQEAPYLYSRALHVSSQWDGDFTALVNEHLPLYIFIGENDEYYGSDKIRNTYAEMAELYRQKGEDINNYVVLDVKDGAYFKERNISNQHGGGMLASCDEEVMNWMFNRKNNGFNLNTTVKEVKEYHGFKGFGSLLFPVHRNIPDNEILQDIGDYYIWYKYIDPDKTVEIVNYLKDQVDNENEIFYSIYSEEEMASDPAKRYTGLFFFKGNSNEKTAIVNAGGGFMYVGAMHDSFPHALELSKMGYNAFALIYRPGWETACEDLARAIAFLYENQEELEIDMDGYSLWGGSAGARMAAWLGSLGTAYFGEKEYPRPGAVIMQYTGLNQVFGNEPPTYNCVGTSDGIASYRTMGARIRAIQNNGTAAEIEVFNGLPHGFGLGTGTVAEGWINNAIEFWINNIK